MPLTTRQYAAKHGLSPASVRVMICRGQLPVISRRPTLIADDAVRPMPRVVRHHKHGGALFYAGGPGKGRRLTLEERHQDALERGAACGCDLCAQVAAQERQASSAKVFEALHEQEDEDGS